MVKDILCDFAPRFKKTEVLSPAGFWAPSRDSEIPRMKFCALPQLTMHSRGYYVLQVKYLQYISRKEQH